MFTHCLANTGEQLPSFIKLITQVKRMLTCYWLVLWPRHPTVTSGRTLARICLDQFSYQVDVGE